MYHRSHLLARGPPPPVPGAGPRPGPGSTSAPATPTAEPASTATAKTIVVPGNRFKCRTYTTQTYPFPVNVRHFYSLTQ